MTHLSSVSTGPGVGRRMGDSCLREPRVERADATPDVGDDNGAGLMEGPDADLQSKKTFLTNRDTFGYECVLLQAVVVQEERFQHQVTTLRLGQTKS